MRLAVESFVMIVALLGASSASGFELQSIDDFLTSQGSGMRSELYAMKRCAALYLSIPVRIGADPAMKSTAAAMSRLAPWFAQAAVTIAEKANLSDTQSTVVKDVQDIAALYAQRMQDSYVATGSALDDMIMSDMTFCKAVSTG